MFIRFDMYNQFKGSTNCYSMQSSPVYLKRSDIKTAFENKQDAISFMKNFQNEHELLEYHQSKTTTESRNAVKYLLHLKEIAVINRINSLAQIKDAGSGHPGGSLSETEILLVLYEIMRHKPADSDWMERDRFVMSKGHATPGLYAQLAMCGYFDHVSCSFGSEILSGFDLLRTFRKDDGYLPGHVKVGVAGIDASTGSLGTGLSIANAFAYVMKKEMPEATAFVLMGDGELQEGQITEACTFSSHYNLGNVIAIIDNNGVQNDFETHMTKNINPIGDKFRAAGWEVISGGMKWEERQTPFRNGHDIVFLINALVRAKEIGREKNVPVVIVADTDKGHGVSFMVEGKGEWHGKAPNDELYDKAMAELQESLRMVRELYAKI